MVVSQAYLGIGCQACEEAEVKEALQADVERLKSNGIFPITQYLCTYPNCKKQIHSSKSGLYQHNQRCDNQSRLDTKQAIEAQQMAQSCFIQSQFIDELMNEPNLISDVCIKNVTNDPIQVFGRFEEILNKYNTEIVKDQSKKYDIVCQMTLELCQTLCDIFNLKIFTYETYRSKIKDLLNMAKIDYGLSINSIECVKYLYVFGMHEFASKNDINQFGLSIGCEPKLFDEFETQKNEFLKQFQLIEVDENNSAYVSFG
jgi:hypothetical protein